MGEEFRNTFLCDIGFGVCICIGGNKYCLFLVDRATRMIYIYIYIWPQESPWAPSSKWPCANLKLIKGESETFLKSNGIQIQAAAVE